MIQVVAGWIPSHKITLVADEAYMGKNLLRHLPANVQAIGPLRWDAALFEQPGPDAHRNRKKGERMPTPKTILADDQKYPVQTVSAPFLGQTKVLEVKRLRGVLWYDVRHTSPVQIVMVRDPSGQWRNEALACTDEALGVAEVLTGYCRRWPIEVEFRGLKQTIDKANLRCRNGDRVYVELDWSIHAMAFAELLALGEQIAAEEATTDSGEGSSYDTKDRSLANTVRAIRRCMRNLHKYAAPQEDLRSQLSRALVQKYKNGTDKKARYRRKNPDKKPLGEPTVRKFNREERKKLAKINAQTAA